MAERPALDDVVVDHPSWMVMPDRPALPAEGEIRPLAEIRDWGLLWLLNVVVFNPRGYAIALHFDGAGDVDGWSLIGDGTEPWTFCSTDDRDLDELYARTAALLAPRAVPTPHAVADAAAA